LAACDLAAYEWARLGSNQRPPLCKRGALPAELHALGGRPAIDPGRGVEPRSPRSERGVLPVRRSRNGAGASPSIPRVGDRRSRRCPAAAHGRVLYLVRLKPNDVFCASRLPFVPGSSIAGCALCGDRCPTWRSFGAGAWRRGAVNLQAKADAYRLAHFSAHTPRAFLSQAGPQFDLCLLQAEHHLWVPTLTDRLQKRKRRPNWVALVWLAMRLGV
jgi:hypothetical protein